MKEDKKFSYLFYNAVTYAGVMLSLVTATVEAFLFALDFFDHGKNLYLGLFTYMLLPGLLIFGLALIPIGVLWKKSRIRRGLPTFELRRFRIDLSLSHHRNALLVFIVGTSLFVLMSLVGAYKAFHYTESVQFCGVLCHQVMNPEFTTYSKSPHGRVKCVECHIGAGADWYMHSKLSGTRQVFKVLTHSYETPIKTPVKDLRPAEDTCKQCHWPGKYFGTMDLKRSYFLTEGDNPKWKLRMLLNVGGGQQNHGIHAHMNLDRDIYYAAEDEQRQKITWVKSIDKDGKEAIFVSPGSRWKNEAPPQKAIRKMDCIDCHNRPTHQFDPPYRLINEAMQTGAINADIPAIKEKAMEVLSKKYATTPEAVRSIGESLKNFYKTKHPDYYASHEKELGQAIQQLIVMYQHNMFPEMKVRWDTHPENIGHLATPGCFRCHDGEHRSVEAKVTPPPDLPAGGGLIPSGSKKSDGGVISKDCKACHLIVEQGPAGAVEKNIEGLEFRHPVDIGNDWKETNCSDCHSGGA